MNLVCKTCKGRGVHRGVLFHTVTSSLIAITRTFIQCPRANGQGFARVTPADA